MGTKQAFLKTVNRKQYYLCSTQRRKESVGEIKFIMGMYREISTWTFQIILVNPNYHDHYKMAFINF